MPYKQKEIEKLYYSIGEVAEMFSVKPSLIRFWEKEFDLIRPAKNSKGNRMFTRQDIEKLRMIHHLVKEKGFTLEGARQKLKKERRLSDSTEELLDTLLSIRSQLMEIQSKL